jgi:hypothetical protein
MAGRAVSLPLLVNNVFSTLCCNSIIRDSCGCGLCVFLQTASGEHSTLSPIEREDFRHGWSPALRSNASRLKVHSIARIDLLSHWPIFNRDPTQHSSLKSEIENQSTAFYSTARLWDDGIIKPTDTRDVVGLGLALAARKRSGAGGRGVSSTTWDGDGKGFGVFRMWDDSITPLLYLVSAIVHRIFLNRVSKILYLFKHIYHKTQSGNPGGTGMTGRSL